MDFELDLGGMIKAVKKAEQDTGRYDLIESDGEQYVFEKIYLPLLENKNIKVSDIDFDAFDEDDIVSIIDNKLESLFNIACGGIEIINCFGKAPPVVSKAKRFF